MIIGSRQRLLVQNDEHIRIEIDGKTIKRVNETKSLGLQIDEHLTWARHACRKYVFPKRWHISLNDKLQKLQNRAAKVITKSRYDVSSSNLFSKLGWDNLLTRRKKT